MELTIKQVAERFSVEPHTLRFYEKEGIIEPARTESGIRRYTEENIGQLEMAMCLKSTGMPLKDIKRYFDLIEEGDETLDERLKIFTDRREHVLTEIEVLQMHLKKIEHKIKWYQGMVAEKKAAMVLSR